ncbi:glutamate-5-semialdehyde dehydrogenase [Amphibacillus cookii]|uniref:glutamate-5-semialdehyde dehydrogenase n=1 Tax=Amphibacillus cookii TaxID=767787 RepID=UPI0019596CA7|nr:glutamate-5-semialdehyde dehydrogenase [Amphibacillus cookii]MBM7540812.1 glutamate-5-semialdehyde dehydrogenase [Amphibacillus cookii]
MSNLEEMGLKAKRASNDLAQASTKDKNAALALIAEQLLDSQVQILEANAIDIDIAKKNKISDAIIDRIRLTDSRIKAISDALLQLIELQDPIGEQLEEWIRPNDLKIRKVAVPIGVVGIIYEARPNVTVDAASLCLKTGNAVILRGSSSAIHSNQAIVQVIRKALTNSNLPTDSVQLIEDTDRKTAEKMFRMNKYLDVLIPRGSKKLIDTVVANASVPVLETGAGNCHMYIDYNAEKDMAINLVINAKTQRPSVCNAIETVIVQKKWFEVNGHTLIHALKHAGVEIHGDLNIKAYDNSIIEADEEDWYTEYLDDVVAMKVVTTLDEAIDHINQYGTKHSEAIITEDEQHVIQFMNQVDAACVYHNASTRFTDGFEFGFGAEIGISTQKLHSRGPMGLKALTSTKYQLFGAGQFKQ